MKEKMIEGEVKIIQRSSRSLISKIFKSKIGGFIFLNIAFAGSIYLLYVFIDEEEGLQKVFDYFVQGDSNKPRYLKFLYPDPDNSIAKFLKTFHLEQVDQILKK